MRLAAYGILAIVFASFILMPLVEIAVVYREKIVMDSAVRNASRVAKDRALEFEGIRDLNADMDEGKFMDYFSEAFEDVMDLSERSSTGHTIRYDSVDGKFNTVTVAFDFYEVERDEGLVSEVKVRVEAAYKFKTKLMRTAERWDPSIHYQLETERSYVLTVKN